MGYSKSLSAYPQDALTFIQAALHDDSIWLGPFPTENAAKGCRTMLSGCRHAAKLEKIEGAHELDSLSFRVKKQADGTFRVTVVNRDLEFRSFLPPETEAKIGAVDAAADFNPADFQDDEPEEDLAGFKSQENKDLYGDILGNFFGDKK